jgi:hypothetical protein
MGEEYPPNLRSGSLQFGLDPPRINLYQIQPPKPEYSPGSLRSVGLGLPRNEIGDKSLYLEYIIQSKYWTDPGIVPARIAVGPPTSSGNTGSNAPPQPGYVNLQLFQPATRAYFYFKIVRLGSPPEIPNPVIAQDNPNYGKMTLLQNNVNPTVVEVMADGYTLVYRIEGNYEYSYITSLNQAPEVPFPIPPWVSVQPFIGTNTISSDYNDGIINNPIFEEDDD